MIFQIILGDYLTGIALALVATLFLNFAPLLMKMALDRMEEIKGNNLWASFKTMFANKRWLLGFSLGIIGGILYFISIDKAGVTIVQPLLNFGLIVLVVMARRLIGEKLDAKAKIAIVLLITMPIFISLGQVTPAQPLQGFSNLIWFTVICLMLIGLLYLISRRIPILWAFTTAIAVGLTAIFTQWFMSAFILALSSTNNLFIAIWDAFVPLLLVGIGNVVANLVFNQIGLQKNPASRFNPINATINVTVAALGGIILFGETVTYWGVYSIGFLMGVIAVILLSRYQTLVKASPEQHPSNFEESGVLLEDLTPQ